MSAVEKLITDNLDIWSSAILKKASAGRGGSGAVNLYGISKLRGLIYDLAMRGLLVPQNIEDEPATSLLTSIEEQKRTLVGSKKKGPPSLKLPTAEQAPYGLPDNWVWSRLGDLSNNIHYGYTAPALPESSGTRLLRITDIQNDKVNWPTVPGCEISAEKSKKYLLENDDILIARTGGTIGKSYLVEGIKVSAVFASYLIRVTRISGMYSAYIKTFLGSGVYWRQLYENASGTGQPNVNATALKSLVVPVAPLAEQHRIVAKVDELMTFCDQLEQQQESSISAHETLVETLLAALTDAADKGEFNQAWERIADNFDTLFTTEHSVESLKVTVLQLAVVGKLTPQFATEEPASLLLESISEKREKLVREKKVKKKTLSPIDVVDAPTLPSGWSWTTLSHLGQFTGGKTPSKNNDSYWKGSIPWVTPKDMKVTAITGAIDGVTQAAIDDGLGLVQPGALLFVARSGILRRAFPVAIAKVECTVNQDLKVLTPFDATLSDYLLLMMKGNEEFIVQNLTKVGTTVESLRFEDFSRHSFMIPPIEEQRRILEKVEALSSVCEKLKVEIRQSQETKIQLANALVEVAIPS